MQLAFLNHKMEKKNHSEFSPAIWSGGKGITIPSNVSNPSEIVILAKALTAKQQKSIVDAVSNQSFEMAAEFVWKRSIARLQGILQSLGMKFIGEMLGRNDIDEFSNVENVLTEYSTLKLSEQLGIFNATGAFRLRQSMEIINHFVQLEQEEITPDDELSYLDAMGIVKNCVQYVLGEQNITVAIEFSRFRARLLSESLSVNDPQVQQLINSPAFYLSTAVTVLLTSITEEKGTKAEHALANLNALVKSIWSNLPEKDKWNLGNVYRDAIAAGNNIISNGIKSALLKVAGFDYVPETLRSSTFSKVASQIIDAHFSYNNFYNEVPLVQNLANLGSIVPKPALLDCIQAYLCVYLGNYYGHSFQASEIAYEQLIKIAPDRWEYYLSKALQDDDIIIYELSHKKPATRFVTLFEKINPGNISASNKNISKLIRDVTAKNVSGVMKAASDIANSHS